MGGSSLMSVLTFIQNKIMHFFYKKNNKDLRRLRSLVLLQLKVFHVTVLVSVPLYNKGVMLQTGSPEHSSILHLGCSSKSLGISLSLIGITKTKASFLMSSRLPLHYFLSPISQACS